MIEVEPCSQYTAIDFLTIGYNHQIWKNATPAPPICVSIFVINIRYNVVAQPTLSVIKAIRLSLWLDANKSVMHLKDALLKRYKDQLCKTWVTGQETTKLSSNILYFLYFSKL